MKRSLLLLLCIVNGISLSCTAQAPDLDRLIANITVAAPPVEALDLAAIQLHYFDSVAPTPAQETKMLEAYKALSAGFAANVHYKQGYNVFKKYLNLKEKIMAREKAGVISRLQNEYNQKDKADEDQVVKLQNEVAQLDMDTQALISMRSGFKNIFSIVIVILSMIFAASLFRSGVRLKNLNAETKSNQEKLAAQHRISSLGYLDGIPGAFSSNETSLKQAAPEASRLAAMAGSAELTSAIQEVSQAAA